MQNHQIKVFSCHTIEQLEKQVNEWLTASPGIEIIQLTQSESGARGEGTGLFITICILFKKMRDRR
jgi:hypothetical protein